MRPAFGVCTDQDAGEICIDGIQKCAIMFHEVVQLLDFVDSLVDVDFVTTFSYHLTEFGNDRYRIAFDSMSLCYVEWRSCIAK